MRIRLVSLAASCLLLAAACSNEPRTPRGEGAVEPSATTMLDASGTPSASQPSASASPSASSAGAATGSPGAATAPPPSGVAMPRPGTYVYAQSGSERFCSSTACGTPRALPERMEATLSHTGGGGASLEMRIASGRLLRTALRYSAGGVALTELYGEVTEAGVTQSSTLTPSPPVRLVVLPLSAGRRWSGSFRDDDSTGTYAFTAERRETIDAAGRRQAAWKVSGSIEVEGPERGTIALTTWLSTDDLTFLRIRGSVSITSSLTRYEADFTELLQSTPA